MTHTLTLETLKAKGAYSEAQEKFAEIFPNGAPLTVEMFVNVAGKFDLECAALYATQAPERDALRAKHCLEREAFSIKQTSGWAALNNNHIGEQIALHTKHDAERATIFATLYI